MGPETLVFFIPILAILLGMVSVVLKHREKMAGLDGRRGSQTIQLLTETLEKEHERIQQLERRVQTLEMIVTDERNALSHQQTRRIELPELPTAEPEAVTPPSRGAERS